MPTVKDTILAGRNVPEAIDMLRTQTRQTGITSFDTALEGLREDYLRMEQCVLEGRRDPDGDAMYNRLLLRTWRLYGDIRMESVRRRRTLFRNAATGLASFSPDMEEMRSCLERFVQDMAMCSLEGEGERQHKEETLADEHCKEMDRMFSLVLVSNQWSAVQSEQFTQLLVSPLVSESDASQLISAAMLSHLAVTDVGKWLALARACRHAACVAVRQRALAAALLTVPNLDAGLFPEVDDTLRSLCEDSETQREMCELQMQVYYCLDAEKDTARIQHDIMPTLLRHTGKGILPGLSDDDSHDIDREETMLNEMEEKIGRMREMEASGSDIWFGGFKNMKRFTFFNTPSHWFVPFSFSRPEVSAVMRGNTGDMLRNVLSRCHFCDSDKYSFVFSFAAVAGRLPSGMLDMLRGEGAAGAPHAETELSPAASRRMYLQDLYRFYTIHPLRAEMESPFDDDGGARSGPLFFSQGCLSPLLRHSEVTRLMRFLMRRGMYRQVMSVGRPRIESGVAGVEERVIYARALMRMERAEEALCVLEQAGNCGEMADPHVLRGMADALFTLQRYKEAAQLYATLMQTCAESRRDIVFHSLALVNDGERAAEGMAALYREHYNAPDNPDIMRALGWGCLMEGKGEQAMTLFKSLALGSNTVDDDFLNYGYALLLTSRAGEAIAMFRRWQERVRARHPEEADIQRQFEQDRRLFVRNGLHRYELTVIERLVKSGDKPHE